MNASRTLSRFLPIVAASLLIAARSQAAWDLQADWSDASNPNGPWSYNAGNTPLPHVSNWTLGGLGGTQPGWAASGSSIPFWYQAAFNAPNPLTYLAGDIIVHSQDDLSGPGQGLANVTWTSPINGVVDISGWAWMEHYYTERGNQWNLYVRGNLISSGLLSAVDSYTRSTPFNFANGSGGAGVLNNISVGVGDVIKLEFVRTSLAGFYIGTDLTVTAVPEPSMALLLGLALAIPGFSRWQAARKR